jgi:hypothetical protein
LIPSIDLLDDVVGVGGPDEGLGFAVVLAEVAVDRRLQVDQRVEGAALQPPAGERGEEGLVCLNTRFAKSKPIMIRTPPVQW